MESDGDADSQLFERLIKFNSFEGCPVQLDTVGGYGGSCGKVYTCNFSFGHIDAGS
jgi:hypothetical protein